jgi:hypothetical protein
MEDKSMSTAYQDVKILRVASCSFVRDKHRSHVVVSGSYGGRYNAFNAAKWGVRGVIMNDAGIGKDNAGIRGDPDRLSRPTIMLSGFAPRSRIARHLGGGRSSVGAVKHKIVNFGRKRPWQTIQPGP